MARLDYNLLLVEDDRNLGYILQEYLTLNDFTVEWAKNGEEGLQIYKSKPLSFDACILDIMMPKKDGFSLADDIKENDPNIPIIFLTAKSLKVDKLKAFKIGCDDYIVKPIDEELLIARIHAILKRTSDRNYYTKEKQLFKIGRYIFDPINQQLKIQTEIISLTAKETELLKLLSLHKNSLLTHSEALTKIWGEEDYFTKRSMDVFITKLRKYLSEDPNVKIENVHGKGFILSD